MSARRLVAACSVLLVHGLGCGEGSPHAATRGQLPSGTLAMVGGSPVSVETVARISAAQKLNPKGALEQATFDALLSRGANQRGISEDPEARFAINAELARRLLRQLLSHARATPPSEEELREATKRKWLDVDRPEGARTMHALVRLTVSDAVDKRERGRAIADAIREAVVAAVAPAKDKPSPPPTTWPIRPPSPYDPQDPIAHAFREAASKIPHDGFDVSIEPLPPVGADGRVLLPGDPPSFDLTFTAAAHLLHERGEVSPVTQTAFGAHVIVLLERTPPSQFSDAERRTRLWDDVVNDRARAAQRELLAPRKAEATIPSEATGLLDLVNVEP